MAHLDIVVRYFDVLRFNNNIWGFERLSRRQT